MLFLQMKNKIFLILLLSVISCSRSEFWQADDEGYFKYSVSAVKDTPTKTTLDGQTLSWDSDDWIGIYVYDGLEELQKNMPFEHKGKGIFDGSFAARKRSSESATYVSYYPFTNYSGYNRDEHEAGIMKAELPAKQKAPFDGDADFMLSCPVTARYDESNMPQVGFEFNEHLFSIIKLTITNTNPKYKDERLVGADISVESGILAGAFTLNLLDDDRMPVFSEGETTSTVSVSYEGGIPPQLGENVEHTLYLVANNIDDKKIKVTVRTVNYFGEVESKIKISTTPGTVTELQMIDFNGLNNITQNKILVYWGDSICNQYLNDELQNQLGDAWTVVRGGVGGDDSWKIGGRQGAIPMCMNETIIISGNSSVRTQTRGLYSSYDSNGNAVITYDEEGVPTISGSLSSLPKISLYTWYDPEFCPLLNHCLINGEECVFTYDARNKIEYVQRAYDGNDIRVSPGTLVESYGSLMYRNARVQVVYMGTNGRTSDDKIIYQEGSEYYSENTDNTDDQLVSFYKKLEAFTPNSKHIMMGFQWVWSNSRNAYGWTSEYAKTMSAAFGSSFLDLHTYGHEHAVDLLVGSGAYPNKESIAPDEIVGSPAGGWPISWQQDVFGNVHPNDVGSAAIAIMIKEKMEVLGYL